MNKKRILKLAEIIGKQNDCKVGEYEGFTMLRHFHNQRQIFGFKHQDCDTPACIAGHAVTHFPSNEADDVFGENFGARKILGLSSFQANALFAPLKSYASFAETDPSDESYISAKRAANVLMHLAETGEVDWRIT